MQRFFTIWMILFVSLNALAQKEQFFHFNIDNGLPSNNVYSVIQDKYGYIWFATDNGVVKYNGQTLKIFNTSTGLPANDVWRLYPDKNGRIWIWSHMHEIGFIQNDKYKRVLKTNSVVSPLSLNEIGKNICFFSRLVPNEDSLDACGLLSIYVDTTLYSTPYFTSKLYHYIPFLDDNGIAYYVDLKNAVYTSKLFFAPFLIKKACIFKEDVYLNFFSRGIPEVRNNGIISVYFNRDNKIFLINTRNCSLDTLHLKQLNAAEDEYIYVINYFKNCCDIVTNKHIFRVDNNFHLLHTTDLNELPANSQVSAMLTDNSKNEWFTTSSDGVWYRLNTKNIFYASDSLRTLNDAKFIKLLGDGSSYWWNKKRNIIFEVRDHFKIDSIQVPDKSIVITIASLNDSEIIITTNTQTYRYNKVTKDIANLTEKYKKVVTKNIFGQPTNITNPIGIKSAIKTKNSIYVSDHNEFFTTASTGFEKYEFFKDSLSWEYIDIDRYSGMIYDSFSKLFFVYNPQKLMVYNKANNKHFFLKSSFYDLFKVNTIWDIKNDQYGNIYILDNDKITFFNPRILRAANLVCNFNITDTHLAIYKDVLLVAGKFEIAYAHINGPLSVNCFRIVPNIKKYCYNRVNDFVVNKFGDIFISSDKGLYTLHINDLLNYEDFIEPDDDHFISLVLNKPFQYPIAHSDTIRISQKVQSIYIESINFLANNNRQFYYFISSYSSDWEQNSSGEILTGGLKPDIYYKIKCFVKDETWKSTERQFVLYIIPHWWQTHTWIYIFWISTVVIILGVLFIVVILTRYFVARSNEKKRALTELELRAVYAQINPHFIFNTLSAAQYFINKKRFDDAYIHINKFSRLLRAYLQSSQNRYTTLSDEIDMLRNYIELQKTRFEEKFDYKIDIDNKIPLHSIKIPSLLLQPIVENAINHGLFHQAHKGFLLLKFNQGEDINELICVIEDNGVGRERSKEINKNNADPKDSYGNKLIGQLIKIFKEYEKMEIMLEYVDKKLPETGTKVILTIKNVKYNA